MTTTTLGPVGTRWSMQVRDVATGAVLHSRDATVLLPTASVAKVFVLVELAVRLVDGRVEPGRLLDRTAVVPVADSGLWQHLSTVSLPVQDVARLVGSVSDNWATNVLLDLLGLDAVQARARSLAPGGSTLHDVVRDRRTAEDPGTLSEGCAEDWASLFADLATGRVVGSEVSGLVLGWLAGGADLSMVPASYGLDPLAHDTPDRDRQVWNKTGTDPGVRADVGLVRDGDRTWSYAALCAWEPAATGADPRDAVLGQLRRLGAGWLDEGPRPGRMAP